MTVYVTGDVYGNGKSCDVRRIGEDIDSHCGDPASEAAGADAGFIDAGEEFFLKFLYVWDIGMFACGT